MVQSGSRNIAILSVLALLSGGCKHTGDMGAGDDAAVTNDAAAPPDDASTMMQTDDAAISIDASVGDGDASVVVDAGVADDATTASDAAIAPDASAVAVDAGADAFVANADASSADAASADIDASVFDSGITGETDASADAGTDANVDAAADAGPPAVLMTPSVSTRTLTPLTLAPCAHGGATDVVAYSLMSRPRSLPADANGAGVFAYDYNAEWKPTGAGRGYLSGYVTARGGITDSPYDYYEAAGYDSRFSGSMPLLAYLDGTTLTLIDDPGVYWADDNNHLTKPVAIAIAPNGAVVRELFTDYRSSRVMYSPDAHSPAGFVDTSVLATASGYNGWVYDGWAEDATNDTFGGFGSAKIVFDSDNLLHVIAGWGGATNDMIVSFVSANAGETALSDGQTVSVAWKMLLQSEVNFPIPTGAPVDDFSASGGLLFGPSATSIENNIMTGIAPDGTLRLLAITNSPHTSTNTIYAEYSAGAWTTEIGGFGSGALQIDARLTGTYPIAIVHQMNNEVMERTAPNTWRRLSVPGNGFWGVEPGNVNYAETRWLPMGQLPLAVSTVAPSDWPEETELQFEMHDDGSFTAVMSITYCSGFWGDGPPVDTINQPAGDFSGAPYCYESDDQLIYYVCPPGGDCFCH